jgi:hypothetical protein
MGHGGRRKGAGAPRGNLNGLKHGRYSQQFAEIGALLAQDPTIRETLLGLARRHNLKQRRANEVAALLFVRLLQRARAAAGSELSFPGSAHEWDSINEAAARAALREVRALDRTARKNENQPNPNQDADTNGKHQSSAEAPGG